MFTGWGIGAPVPHLGKIRIVSGGNNVPDHGRTLVYLQPMAPGGVSGTTGGKGYKVR